MKEKEMENEKKYWKMRKKEWKMREEEIDRETKNIYIYIYVRVEAK